MSTYIEQQILKHLFHNKTLNVSGNLSLLSDAAPLVHKCLCPFLSLRSLLATASDTCSQAEQGHVWCLNRQSPQFGSGSPLSECWMPCEKLHILSVSPDLKEMKVQQLPQNRLYLLKPAEAEGYKVTHSGVFEKWKENRWVESELRQNSSQRPRVLKNTQALG